MKTKIKKGLTFKNVDGQSIVVVRFLIKGQTVLFTADAVAQTGMSVKEFKAMFDASPENQPAEVEKADENDSDSGELELVLMGKPGIAHSYKMQDQSAWVIDNITDLDVVSTEIATGIIQHIPNEEFAELRKGGFLIF